MYAGRTTVFTKEAAEGEEAAEPSEEESEQGPEPLSTLDKDAEVEGIEAWTPIFSSTNSGVKNQASCEKDSETYNGEKVGIRPEPERHSL